MIEATNDRNVRRIFREARSTAFQTRYKLIWCEDIDRDAKLLIIRALCTDSHSIIRNDCAEQLLYFGTKADGHRLRVLSADPEWLVRCTAVVTLANIQGVGCISFLKKAWSKEIKDTVRMHICLAMEDIGPAAIPALIRFAELDESLEGLSGALYALSMLGHAGAKSHLETLGQDGDRVDRKRTANFLSNIEKKYSAP